MPTPMRVLAGIEAIIPKQTALTLVTEGPRGGAVMRAIGYLTICATIGGILALSTPFTERRSIKTWAPNVVVAAPKPVATVINAPQSPAAAVAMVDALKPSHVPETVVGGANTLLRRNRPRLERSPGNRCAAEASRSGDAGGSASEFARGSETPARSRAPRRDCHGLNGRWRKSPRSLFGLPESRSSSGWPKEDTENSRLGARPELTRGAEPEAAYFRRVWGHEHCCSKRQPQPRPLMLIPLISKSLQPMRLVRIAVLPGKR